MTEFRSSPSQASRAALGRSVSAATKSLESGRTRMAVELTMRFLNRTGITESASSTSSGISQAGLRRRYLWTDAFCVQNLVGLAETTGSSQRYGMLARSLARHVHASLGCRHGKENQITLGDQPADSETAKRHPTMSGMRIGKKLPERSPNEPYDDRLEWDRDGSYFHYVTKWAGALHSLARFSAIEQRPGGVSAVPQSQPQSQSQSGAAAAADKQELAGQPDAAQLELWARELMLAARRGFVYRRGSTLAMYWKMTEDMSRPLVMSQGHHDPLDGYITCLQLQAAAKRLEGGGSGRGGQQMEADLGEAIETFGKLVRSHGSFATTDSLGLGGLLVDVLRLARLPPSSEKLPVDPDELLERISDDALHGLERYVLRKRVELGMPARMRLAFRELGLSIGLHAAEMAQQTVSEGGTERRQFNETVRSTLKAIASHVSLRREIEEFWMRDEARETSTWRDHEDINEVMLATSLAPEGVLDASAP